jgi:hypothetical protein
VGGRIPNRGREERSVVEEIDRGVRGYPKRTTRGRVQVHSLSPGMVFTKLLLDDSTPGERKSKHFCRCLLDIVTSQ